jgi:TrpR-related protein YerC/YecD
MKPRNLGKTDPKAEEALYEALLCCRNVDEMKQFFTDLCTPNERQALSDRWKVIAPILQGVPYRTIYENTGVSVTTIGRVARCLAEGSGGYGLIFERINDR